MKIITQVDGLLALQHKGYKEGDFDLDYRACVMAVRIRSRLVQAGDLGHWVYRKEEIGDLGGGMFWDADPEKRPINSFQFAWPVQAVPMRSGTATVGVSGALPAPDMSPLGKHDDLGAAVDERWLSKAPVRPKYEGRASQYTQQKFPLGTYGVAMAATEENDQVDLFLHADARLVAVNRAGDGLMGSRVYDITNRGEYDPDRDARLQTAWRVVRPLMSCTAGVVTDPERPLRRLNALAWNLALTGREQAFGRGLWIDNGWGAGMVAT